MEKKSYETYTFYVGNNGKDTNPGTLDEPFATLEHARQAIRQFKQQVNGQFTVLVREGTYYFENTLTFEPEDSGSEGVVITYQAYPGEKVILSGGRRIVGEWRPYRDGIVVCELSDWAETDISFTQLFVDGRRQTRARYPKADTAGTKAGGMLHPAASKLVWPHTQFKFDPATFTKKRWSNPQEAIVHILAKNYWGNLQWQVADIDWDANTVYLGKGGYQINDIMQGEDATGIDERSLYYIENVFEELDSPGEWYCNRQEKKLYWMPQEDVDIHNTVVEVSGLKRLLQFKGSQETPVHHIRLSGFQIAHTETTFLEAYEAPSLGDWTIHRGGAVYFEGSEHCVVEHCFFDAVGGNAIFLSNYNLGNILYGNKITEAGESGVCIVGSKHLTLGSNHAYSSKIEVCNNLIHDIGTFGKQTAGVFMSVSKENTVSHNHICHVPRAAICINDGTWGGHVIAFNDIHDTVRETGDHGPFNSWGRDRFWCLNQSHGPSSHCAGDVKRDAQQTVIIRNNRFRDHKGWGDRSG
ncbi:right-handed parallel beta-helix repeat-containing protein [Paenibacillus sp. N3.4]|uniref:right-handed parallel beta-helix repeat-containing protein n=1 Tax=Paenibacillus sp. N3.4 TaxID=2603222 RepID=UPI0011C8D620|nr:right-handed parallel beta-helix repeat-containing protein [Paenibacillus sp. N3.4]TXK83784.1 right-handed parallel beta-helix repeat-containing protein [Paenibacillus sp. N3.4]